MRTDGDLRVAVVGTGRMGANHAQRLAGTTQHAAVGAVVDIDMDRARAVGAQVSRIQAAPVPAFASIEEMLAADVVDAVLLVTPGALHERALVDLIEAGVPVLCEKPLTPEPESAVRVLRAEQRAGRRLIQVGFHRRFDAEYRQLKQIVDSGQLGQLLMMHFQHRNPAAPEWFTEEMLINDSVVHEFDALRFFTGEEITSVHVRTGRSTVKGMMRDPQMVLMQTSSGLLADVEIFMNARLGYQVQAQAVFEDGVVSAGHPSGLQMTAQVRQSLAIAENFYDRFAPAYDQEVQEWVNAVRAGGLSGPSAWDGYATAACCDAGVASQQSGNSELVHLIDQPPLYR
ncbi:Gfo/Idh/MocA family protein [Pseudactinotalea sp. Z1748]|uniref:Gfo/Idh/MocA family protein n=1 Tax=Pseudactinotalea sp. Z1748 TaxID=3413027 RepID=UPI003C7DCBAE